MVQRAAADQDIVAAQAVVLRHDDQVEGGRIDQRVLDMHGAHPPLRDDNDDWAFYLQENATFRYKKKEVKWSGLRPRRVRGQFREQCRPMNLKQFFPAVVDNAPRWTFG